MNFLFLLVISQIMLSIYLKEEVSLSFLSKIVPRPISFQNRTPTSTIDPSFCTIYSFFTQTEFLHLFQEVTIIFCNENQIDLEIEPVPKKRSGAKKQQERGGRKSVSKTQPHATTLFDDMESLVKDTLQVMANNEMVAVTYSSELERLTSLEKFPLLEKLKSAFVEGYKEITTEPVPSPRAKETMWMHFNKIWTDKDITNAIREGLSVSKDFCSWFLFTLQQVVSKKSVPEARQVVPQELTDDEKDTVAYICGSLIRKLTSKFHILRRKTKIENVPLIQKHINIISACKDQDLNSGPRLNSQNKLIDTLTRGGLVYPKREFVNSFFEVEKIFRETVGESSTYIDTGKIQSICLDMATVTDNFYQATEFVEATDGDKADILKCCITLYVKIRSFAHAKNSIEKYRAKTQTERKKKALRKNLKKKDSKEQSKN